MKKYLFNPIHTVFQEESGDDGASASSGQATTTEPTIENPQALLSTLEKLKAEKKTWKSNDAELKRLQGLQSSFEAILGETLSPEQLFKIKTQVSEAERISSEAQQQEEQIKTRAIEEAKATLSPQIETLTQTNLALTSQINSIFEQQAVQQAFNAHNGSDLVSFQALAPTVFKPEYQEFEDPTSPTGIRKKLIRYTQLDGQPLTDSAGKELTLADIFSRANQGQYGNALKSTFHDYNQASGDGFVQNPADGTTTKNPWSKEHFNLTRQGQIFKTNKQLAKKMQAAAAK